MNTQVAIVGYGSIGRKHEQALTNLGISPFIISRSQSSRIESSFSSLTEILKEKKIDIIAVCTESSNHIEVLKELDNLGYQGKILIEKPIFERAHSYSPKSPENIFVAYNLRFVQGLEKLKTEIEDQKVLQVVSYVGQYLPTWRERNYKDSYSAKKSEGGGVLRDLSHELDYLVWLFGAPQTISSLGGKFSDLEIETDDTQTVLMEMDHCKCVSVSLNYTDRITQRFLTVVTSENTYRLDFVENKLIKNQDTIPLINLNTYEKEWNELINNPLKGTLCTYKEGVEILELISSIEQSQLEKKVINFEK